MVGVMGSGRDAHAPASSELGRWLAGEGVHLLTGGGGGVMAEVSRAFAQVAPRAGLVLAVLPADPTRPGQAPAGYPNPWVEFAIRTHLPLRGERGAEPLSRNAINVLSADLVLALPGGAGTASEVALALEHDRPLLAYLPGGGAIPDLPAAVPRAERLSQVADFVRARLAG